MLLIDFKDAVNASVLDPGASHAVFYCDGSFQNEAQVRAQCPHARLYAITVFGRTGPGIFACDSETGDMNVDQTVAWVEEQIRLNVPLIVVYANLNRWLNEGLLARLAKYQHRIKRWVALYDFKRHIQPWADAEQWADGSVDRNVALANFFGNAPSMPPTPHTTGVLHFTGTFDPVSGQWAIHGAPGQKVHFAGPDKWASAEVQVKVGHGGGQWRARGIRVNSGPLGG